MWGKTQIFICLKRSPISSKMTSIHSKIFEMFKNLKSDAMPKPPRPSRPTEVHEEPNEENEEYIDSTNEPEEVIVESDDDDTAKNEKKPKFKKSFFKSNKKDDKPEKSNNGSSNVNTQATGNVINIVNSKNVRWGNDYYMGPTNMKPPTSTDYKNGKDKEEHIEKNNLIMLLLEAKIKPEHMFINYVSKNLGKNWHSFFRTLGFTKGAIETKQIDMASYGVSEARYKLLLDWINDDADGSRTLGRLANLLWEEGERELVKELALLYRKASDKN